MCEATGYNAERDADFLPDGASIILNASIVASKGLPSWSVYSATNAAALVRAHMDH
jgi:hypothetical protein